VKKKTHWQTFFRWVKECVPSFDPDCVVSDGADYIHTAFNEAVKPKVLHAICWWHKNRAVKRLFGIMGAIAKSLQTMVYADTVDELIKRENRVKEILDRINTDQLKDASIRKRQIEELYNTLSDITDHTFITLPVFTANSYTESINSCLRKIGLTALGTSRLESIFLLRSYCKSCVPVIKTYSKERRVLL